MNKHDDLKWKKNAKWKLNKVFSKICDFLITISTKIMLIENKLKNELKVEMNFFAKLRIR